jgi:hypothetical protein
MAIGLMMAPMLGALGLRTLSNQQVPSMASGAEISLSKGQFVMPASPKPNAELRSLAETINNECQQPFGTSPMVNRAPLPSPVPTVASKVDAPVVPDATTPPIPGLTLTSIMNSKGQPIAVINGKLHRVGDALSNGFGVTSIDGEAGTVEVADSLGRHVTLSLKKHPE